MHGELENVNRVLERESRNHAHRRLKEKTLIKLDMYSLQIFHNNMRHSDVNHSINENVQHRIHNFANDVTLICLCIRT
jgi:hypothetical protein